MKDTPQAPKGDVCPIAHAGRLSSPLRRFIHNPEKILRDMIREGDTVADIGCGPGYFTIPMSKLVGENGRVIAVDLQQEMLDIMRRNAEKAGFSSRIQSHLCQPDHIGIEEPVDFALAFYVVHEAPDAEQFLREIRSFLKPEGKLLIVEPKFRFGAGRNDLSAEAFEKTVNTADSLGLRPISAPPILLSRSTLFGGNQGRPAFMSVSSPE